MKRILVTGAAGKLGKEIVMLLRKKNYEVIGLDLLASETTDFIVDIRDFDSVLHVAQNSDAIIHSAALHGRHMDLDFSRDEFVDTNIKGTLNLLNACIKLQIKKFLYTSTTSIYGSAMVNPKQAVWVDETLTPEPRDIYDITKLTCELLCKDFFEKEGLETTVLRVSRFLPEDDNTKANHRIYRGLDEEDGAMAHLLALEHDFKSFEIFNVSNESPFTRSDLIDLYNDPRKVIAKYYPNIEAIYKERKWEFLNRIDRVYAIDKAKSILNFRPTKNFDSFL